MDQAFRPNAAPTTWLLPANSIVLVLTAPSRRRDHFAPIAQGSAVALRAQGTALGQRFTLRNRMPVKKTYSFIRRPQDLRDLPAPIPVLPRVRFHASRSAVIFFGLLVHQTIEEIHRIALDGKLHTLASLRIRELFDRTSAFWFERRAAHRPTGRAKHRSHQVLNYFRQNRRKCAGVIQTEVERVLGEGWLHPRRYGGLALGGDGKLDCSTFKTSHGPRTARNS